MMLTEERRTRSEAYGAATTRLFEVRSAPTLFEPERQGRVGVDRPRRERDPQAIRTQYAGEEQ
jgi:hypothetical protein